MYYCFDLSSVVLQVKLSQKILDEMFIKGHDKRTC